VTVNASINLTFTAGTAAAWFTPYVSGGPGYGVGVGYGISLGNDASVTLNGTATAPCQYVQFHTVQECTTNWMNGWLSGVAGGTVKDYNNPSVLTANFTHFSEMAADSDHFRDGPSGESLLVRASNCEILGQFGGYNLLGTYTNCLFDRVAFWQGTGDTNPYVIFRNITFHGGSVGFTHWEAPMYGDAPPYWYSSARNCAFDGTTFAIDDPFGVNTNYADYNYNAFLAGVTQMSPEGTNNVVVTNSFNWQVSWLGSYYLTNSNALVDKGDRTADQLGLYHFTMLASQIKETNSVVDIGYHYVATDMNGNPLDYDGDGIPDYLEDANGNGVVDNGETSWTNYNSGNGLTSGNGLMVFTPLK
jgi:hypothetical protein